LSTAAAAQEPPPGAARPVSSDIAHSAAQRCRAHASVNVCDDALRWNPSDPSLLAAMGDALMRARRAADAVRVYQRAAALAPDTPGIGKKIEAAQASVRRHEKKALRDASAAGSGQRFSNSDPETQTH
jgi:cytochrome c-type biogenesis protein CcmH/NrfG